MSTPRNPRDRQPPSDHRPGAVPPELVDAFFDRELDESSRERFFGALRGDLPACAQVARTQRMLSQLRAPVDAPDLTERILGELRARDHFLPRRLRSMVKVGRLGLAACLLLGVLGVALAYRYAPDSVRLTPAAKPVTGVIASGASEAAAGVQQLSAAVNLVGGAPAAASPAPGAPRSPYGSLSLRLSPGAAPITLPKPGSGAIVVYSGAGADGRFLIPEAIILDRVTACISPLGALVPVWPPRDWTVQEPGAAPASAGMSREDSGTDAGGQMGTIKVRVVKPAEKP
jgi:hypothetical protein